MGAVNAGRVSSQHEDLTTSGVDVGGGGEEVTPLQLFPCHSYPTRHITDLYRLQDGPDLFQYKSRELNTFSYICKYSNTMAAILLINCIITPERA